METECGLCPDVHVSGVWTDLGLDCRPKCKECEGIDYSYRAEFTSRLKALCVPVTLTGGCYEVTEVLKFVIGCVNSHEGWEDMVRLCFRGR